MSIEVALQSLPYSKRKLWKIYLHHAEVFPPLYVFPAGYFFAFPPIDSDGYSYVYCTARFTSTFVFVPPGENPLNINFEQSRDDVTWDTVKIMPCSRNMGNFKWGETSGYYNAVVPWFYPRLRATLSVGPANTGRVSSFLMTMVMIP